MVFSGCAFGNGGSEDAGLGIRVEDSVDSLLSTETDSLGVAFAGVC